jgi:peroxiredoxin
MKYLIVLFFLISLSVNAQYNYPEVDAIELQKNFTTWQDYQTQKIMLSLDFVALDENSIGITKDSFFNQLTSGNFIPIRLQSKDSSVYYKLFKINANSDSSIKATIMQIAFEEYEHFKMEGNLFPKFNFTDLNGTIISNDTMKDKIIVIKCWYIHCAACIKEFTDVNALVSKYKDRKDILFLSLAEDSPEQLKLFLSKKPLFYSVIPNMKIYMNETLNLNAFPTHFIINKQGKIVKVLSNFESLKVALEAESKE